MSNIIIPNENNFTGIVDYNGKPISRAEAEAIRGKKKTPGFKFIMPIGKGVVYFKIKSGDKWHIGYTVEGTRIPPNATAISDHTAFKMMNPNLVDKGTNKDQWKKVGKSQQGCVIIETPTNEFGGELPNANDDEQFAEIKEVQKKVQWN